MSTLVPPVSGYVQNVLKERFTGGHIAELKNFVHHMITAEGTCRTALYALQTCIENSDAESKAIVASKAVCPGTHDVCGAILYALTTEPCTTTESDVLAAELEAFESPTMFAPKLRALHAAVRHLLDENRLVDVVRALTSAAVTPGKEALVATAVTMFVIGGNGGWTDEDSVFCMLVQAAASKVVSKKAWEAVGRTATELFQTVANGTLYIGKTSCKFHGIGPVFTPEELARYSNCTPYSEHDSWISVLHHTVTGQPYDSISGYVCLVQADPHEAEQENAIIQGSNPQFASFNPRGPVVVIRAQHLPK